MGASKSKDTSTEITDVASFLEHVVFKALVYENSNNLIYSPLSLKYALQLLYLGADKFALDQLGKILDGKTVGKFEASNSVAVANSLWIGDKVEDSYLKAVASLGQVKAVDFKDSSTVKKTITVVFLKMGHIKN